MENFYKINLLAIKESFPNMVERFEEVKRNRKILDHNEYTIIFDRSMRSECIIAVESEQNITYLNSRYDAGYAANVWSEDFGDMNYRGIVVLIGISNSIYVRQLLQKLGQENIVILYEPSEQLFMQLMDEVDLSDLIRDKRLILFINNINMNMFREYFRLLMGYDQIELSKMVVSPNYDRVFSDEIATFKNLCTSEAKTVCFANNTSVLYGAEMNDNLINNISTLVSGSSIDNLKTEFKKLDIDNVPAIIVAAGPSLDKNIEQLCEAHGKALIVAVDSAIRALLEKNIIPDLLVTIDPHKPMMLFEDERVSNIPLVICTHSRHEILERHKGKKFIFADCNFIVEIYNRLGEHVSGIETGGSVANTAFSLSVYLGFRKIILVGQDLAFTDMKKHVKNVYDEAKIGEDPVAQYTQVEGVDGKLILTYRNFALYRDSFEAMIRENTDIKVINATEGGALIHGAEHIKLELAIRNYCCKEIHFKEIISSSRDSFDEDKKKAYWTLFKEIPTKVKQLERRFKEGIGYYQEFKKMIKDDDVRADEFKKLLQQIEKINNIENEEPFMELVTMYAKEEEYQIAQNIYDTESDLAAEGDVIADKGIALLNAYISASKKLYLKLMESLEGIKE